MQRSAVIVSLVVVLFAVRLAYAEDYQIIRSSAGPFAVSISGTEVNVGSSMQRESIILNENSCPAQLIGFSLKYVFEGRDLRYDATTTFDVTAPVAAVQVRTGLYDVFDQHIRNLADTEPRDMAVGPQAMSETWQAYNSDVSDMLTTVTYVARVRLADGTQWVARVDDVDRALSSLNLEERK